MAAIFPTVSVFRKGYEPRSVDRFFQEARSAYEGGTPGEVFSASQVRAAAFPLKRGGYETRAVDSALNRLEAAFVQRDRMDFISVNGENGWYSRVAEDATVLYPRLLRPVGRRFSHPAKRELGYRTDEVDALLNRLTDYFDGRANLDVGDIRKAQFSAAKGTAAYREDQVDAYLGRAVEILLCAV